MPERLHGQYRRVLFTYHPPGEPVDVPSAEPLVVNSAKTTYVVWQWERGGETNKLHGQGFASFPGRLRLDQILALFSHPVHVKPVLKHPEKAIEYCKKQNTNEEGQRIRDDGRVEGTEPFEHGDPGKIDEQRGKRTDVGQLVEAIDDDLTPAQIRREVPDAASKCQKFVDRMFTDRLKARARQREPPDVILYWGPTGVGKTSRAISEVQDMHPGEDPYDFIYFAELTGNQVWFDGYQGEDVIIFDDVGPGWFEKPDRVVRPETMLRWLDRYPIRLNVKCDHSWLCASRIYLTSNLPAEAWDFGHHHEALMRRLTHVEHIGALPMPPN